MTHSGNRIRVLLQSLGYCGLVVSAYPNIATALDHSHYGGLPRRLRHRLQHSLPNKAVQLLLNLRLNCKRQNPSFQANWRNAGIHGAGRLVVPHSSPNRPQKPH
uniref:Uncharacterized protein n=1 Tax=Ixodes ricinus TaxID=34613 RepID=A0A6B0U874_IXORI